MEYLIQWVESHPFITTMIAFLLTYVIEISKIKINPYSWFFKKISNAINGDVIKKIDNIEKDLSEIKEQQNEAEEQRKLDQALSARRRIIRSADEVGNESKTGIIHSEEFYNEALDDCTTYENYCLDHPKFKNNKAKNSIEIIRSAHKRHATDKTFL